MSFISPQGEQSTSSEISLLTALNNLGLSGSGQFIRKTGTSSFENAAPSIAVAIGIGTLVGIGDGSTTAFTLPFTPSVPTEVILFVGGAPKFPVDDFVLIGDVATFITAPRNNQKIRILALK